MDGLARPLRVQFEDAFIISADEPTTHPAIFLTSAIAPVLKLLTLRF
jgi:hypothetical protein